MMTVLRAFAVSAFAAALLVGCSSQPSAQERIATAELAQMAPLKQTYSGVVMGFDLEGDKTLIVSLDIQSYIGMDDPAADAMRRTVVARWRSAWSAAHPHAHANLRARFIDFVGKKIDEESTSV